MFIYIRYNEKKKIKRIIAHANKWATDKNNETEMKNNTKHDRKSLGRNYLGSIEAS